MPRPTSRLSLSVLCSLLLTPALGHAAAIRWANPVSGNWNLNTNWSPASVPGVTDTAVIDVAGSYIVTLNANASVAALRISGAASGVQTLTGTTRTLTIANASSIGAQGALTLSGTSVINGTGSLTNEGTLTISATTVSVPVTNRGTLLVQTASSSLSGAFANQAGGTLRVQGAAAAVNFTVSNGFTNNGTIELTSTGGGVGNLTVTTGTLVNALGATISSLPGGSAAAVTRQLNAKLDNQGTITVAQPLTTTVASVAHLNSGTIDLTGGDYTVTLSGAGASWTTTGTVSVPTGRKLNLVGTAATPFQYNGGTLGGAGTVSVNGSNLVLGAAASSASLNLATTSSATLSGAASYTVAAGDTATLSNYTVTAPLVVQAGGLLQMVAGDLNGTVDNSGGIDCTGACTTTGLITTHAGSSLRVLANGAASSLTSSGGFTNNGTIDLTSSGAGTTNLTVSSPATLINAPGGTIRTLTGTVAGARQLNAALDNQGTIDIQQTATTTAANADHVNSGTILVSGGNYTVSYTGASPTFTNTGTISISAGRLFTVNGAAVANPFQWNAGSVSGAGNAVFSVVNLALGLGVQLATNTTNLTGSTGFTMSGPGTFVVKTGTSISLPNTTLNAATTVEPGGTLFLPGSDVPATLTNGGTVEFSTGTNTATTIVTSPGSLLRVLANVNGTTLTVANGFTNNGTIELTSSALTAPTLTVASGTLTIAPGANLVAVAGSGGGRILNAKLDNQGTVSLLAPLTINKATTAHTNSGLIEVLGGDLTVSLSGGASSFTNTGTIAVAATRTASLNGAVAGGANYVFHQDGGSMGGAGAVSLLQSTLALGVGVATDVTRLDASSSTIAGPGTLTCKAGTITTLGTTTLTCPTVVEAGATLNLPSSDMNGALTNGGIVAFTGGSSSTGLFTTQSGSTLRFGAGTCTVANGFTNTATIELDSSTGGSSTLAVTSGTLVNALGASIVALPGAGGVRALTAKLDNQGTIDVQSVLQTSKPSVSHVNSGSISLNGGNYTIALSGAASTFTTSGNINVPAGRTLFLNGGNIVNGVGYTYQYAGGTMGGGGTIRVANASLALQAEWPTNQAQLQMINSSLLGPDTLRVKSGSAPSLDSTTVTAPVAIESGGSLKTFGSQLNARVNNAGLLECTGVCRTSGDISTLAGSTLRVLGTSETSSSLIFPDAWVNTALVELTSSGGPSPVAALTITVGALINSASGIVRALPGLGGARQVNAILDNSGLFDIQANTSMTQGSTATILNRGTIDITPGRTLTVGGNTINSLSGALITGSGTITLSGGGGTGQNGVVRPGGASNGVLRFNSSMLMNSTASLEIQVGGDTPGTGFDQIQLRDAATLNGTLAISTADGFQPTPGRRYQIARFSGRFGTFANVTGQSYAPGQLWAVTYSDSDVVLLAQDQTWSRVHPDGAAPAAREGHAAVYDSTGDRMVVFGGRSDTGVRNDVWVLSKATGFNYPAWSALSPSGTPPAARMNASAVYDPASNRMIVFGGDDGAPSPTALGDVWVLTNANGTGGSPAWIALTPAGTPPAARSGHGAAYDAPHDRMMVFGGDTNPAACGGESNEVWVLDHASGLGGTPTWSLLAASGVAPSARANAGVMYDEATNRLIVTGGDACGSANSDAFLLEAGNGLGGPSSWSAISPLAPAPAGWSLARHAYDRTLQWVDSYGGKFGAEPTDSAYTLTSANSGAGSSWYRRLAYGDRPPARSRHSMIMANASHTAVVFGGRTSSGLVNDVWRRQANQGPVLEVDPPVALPAHTAFALPPSPNPAVGAVQMAIDVAHDQRVELAVYDVHGRRVAVLHDGELAAGRHRFTWQDGEGRPAAPGIYMVRMKSADRTQVMRVVRLD